MNIPGFRLALATASLAGMTFELFNEPKRHHTSERAVKRNSMRQRGADRCSSERRDETDCSPGLFKHRGKSTTDCRPRSEPRSERAQERKAAPTWCGLGNKLALLPACTLHRVSLQASSRQRPIACDRRGSLLRHSSV